MRVRYNNVSVERRWRGAFTCGPDGVWLGELQCPNNQGLTPQGESMLRERWEPAWASRFHILEQASEGTKAGHTLVVNENGRRCDWIKTSDLPYGPSWLAGNVRQRCGTDRDCDADRTTPALVTTGNAVHCYGQVWYRDGRVYRVLPEGYPFAGALQRAERTEFCGIQGDMALPDSASKQRFLRKVRRRLAPMQLPTRRAL